jgi:hypothetical protein
MVFVSFEAKKFSPLIRFEAKITKSKRSEKFKAKRSEKKRKNRPKFSLRFVSLRSENYRSEAKRKI